MAAAEDQGALSLIFPLLLLYLKKHLLVQWVVDSEPDLPSGLKTVLFVKKVLVKDRVKVQGPDPITSCAIVGVLNEKPVQIGLRSDLFHQIQQVFFFASQYIALHYLSPVLISRFLCLLRF